MLKLLLSTIEDMGQAPDCLMKTDSLPGSASRRLHILEVLTSPLPAAMLEALCCSKSHTYSCTCTTSVIGMWQLSSLESQSFGLTDDSQGILPTSGGSLSLHASHSLSSFPSGSQRSWTECAWPAALTELRKCNIERVDPSQAHKKENLGACLS